MQSEIADEPGNSYIAETITDNIRIQTPNLGFTTMESSQKDSSVLDSDRLPPSDEGTLWLEESAVIILVSVN